VLGEDCGGVWLLVPRPEACISLDTFILLQTANYFSEPFPTGVRHTVNTFNCPIEGHMGTDKKHTFVGGNYYPLLEDSP
jgi:hypothetical protein